MKHTPRVDALENMACPLGIAFAEWHRSKYFRLACQLEVENAELQTVLQRYISAYPAFRMKPIGAPGSPARIEQENLMALEETARAAIARARGE